MQIDRGAAQFWTVQMAQGIAPRSAEDFRRLDPALRG